MDLGCAVLGFGRDEIGYGGRYGEGNPITLRLNWGGMGKEVVLWIGS